MADNLARSSDDAFDEDPSLDSILNRLNSLGESSQDGKEVASPIRGVPDLSPDEKSSIPDSSDEAVEPALLKVVDDTDEFDSRFRSQGLFEVPEADEAAVVVVVSQDALASFVADGKEEPGQEDSNKQEDSKKTEPEEETNEPEEETNGPEETCEVVDPDTKDEKPERIDYFADLHVGEPTQIAGVPTIAEESDEVDLDPGFTVEQAFSKHPEGTLPDNYETDEEVLLTDTHGLLADPLDIKDVATTMDGADYQEHFAHGVQFPGMDGSTATKSSKSNPLDPIHVESPYEDLESSSKGLSLQSIVFGILLVAAIIVLYMILGNAEAVDDLREGVNVIAE